MSTIKGINIGSTDITASYTDVQNQTDKETLTVVAVSLNSIGTPSNTIYTGSEQTPTPSVTAIVDGKSMTLSINNDYTLSYSNNINAGTATVTATGKGNFTGTVSANWTIGNATISVNASNQEYTYNGKPQGVGITASGVTNNITIKYGTEYGKYPYDTAPQITNVVDSKYIYYKVTSPNHTDVESSYYIEIKKFEATLTWGTLTWTYDGLEHKTTCTVSNLIGNDTCEVILDGNSITEIGETTVSATGLKNENYKLPSSNTSKTLTVSPGLFIKVSGVWTPVKKVYKKINGSWVEQSMLTAFDTTKLYMKKD